MASFQRINDLSQFALRRKFLEQEFKPETNFAVAMGRVSIKKNKDSGNSDVAQLETIGEYSEKEKLTIVRTWDVSESGSKHDKRKHFLEMIDFVRASQETARPIKHILFSHQSRSNRNRESAREIEALVRSIGLTLHCARDHLKLTTQSTLEEWMRWDLFNNLNEKFIKDHTRNVMDGTFKRVEMGLFPGKAPFGYRNFRSSERDTSIFQIVEPQASYMKTAFELFSTGRYTDQSLKNELSRRYPQIKKTPEPKRFAELLRNPFYYGDFTYGGETHQGNPEYHPRLISRQLWDQVQQVFIQPSRSRKTVKQKEHSYLGILRCGGFLLDQDGKVTDIPCGVTITAEEKRKKLADGSIKRFYYYHCSRNSSSHGGCNQRNKGYMTSIGRNRLNFSESEIEELFEVIVKPLSFTPEVAKWMQEALVDQSGEKSKTHESLLSSLQFQYRSLDRKITAAYNDKINGAIDESLWETTHARLSEEKRRVEEQLRAVGDERGDYLERGVLLIELVQSTENAYKKATSDIKRKIIEIVSSNHVLENGSLRFDYRKPFDILASAHPKEKWWTLAGSNR
jgi:site-specific DNA recombinase